METVKDMIIIDVGGETDCFWIKTNATSTLVVAVKPRGDAVEGEKLLGRVSDNGQHVAHEAIDVSTPGRLVNNVLVVVVTQAATKLLVVHLGLVLARAPASSYFVRIAEAELPVVARPRDVVLARRVQQQFQQKLPQLDRTAACKYRNSSRSVRVRLHGYTSTSQVQTTNSDKNWNLQ